MHSTKTPGDNAGTGQADTLHGEWLIVGLGNPGDKYAATRHNVGYMALDDLAARSGDVLNPIRGIKALATQVNIGETPAVLMRSTTFMNNSGEAVAPLAQKLGIPSERIIVIHDELDIAPYSVKLRQGGAENGHNGLKSISEHLGSREYIRVRIGIGRPQNGESIPDFVLASVDTALDLDKSLATAADSVELIVTQGLAKAQNVIHSRK